MSNVYVYVASLCLWYVWGTEPISYGLKLWLVKLGFHHVQSTRSQLLIFFSMSFPTFLLKPFFHVLWTFGSTTLLSYSFAETSPDLQSLKLVDALEKCRISWISFVGSNSGFPIFPVSIWSNFRWDFLIFKRWVCASLLTFWTFFWMFLSVLPSEVLHVWFPFWSGSWDYFLWNMYSYFLSFAVFRSLFEGLVRLLLPSNVCFPLGSPLHSLFALKVSYCSFMFFPCSSFLEDVFWISLSSVWSVWSVCLSGIMDPYFVHWIFWLFVV